MRWLLRAAALSLLAAPALGAGCAEDTIEVDVRSLDRSGHVSFVCLDDPTLGAAAARPVADCQKTAAQSAQDYTVPHLYAMVTQLTRGEIAVIDLSTISELDDVIDQNTRVPGANFLPVGAQPVDVVSTPGSTATFVAVAEVGRRGIFALPSTLVRPGGRTEQPTLSSWPACSLGARAPGSMLVVGDPADAEGGVRESCDGAYGPPSQGATGNPDFSSRQKLLVTIPDESAIAVIDAQSLAARDAGSFEPCDIERWIPLAVQPGALPAPQTYPVAGGCVNPEVPTPDPVGAASRPAGMAIAGDRLYVADLEAPVIHVLDMVSPCDLAEREPLLPTSVDDPERVVTTSRLAAMNGTTKDFKRYLYAIDADQGSVMAFDISDEGAAPRTPLTRADANLNPRSVPDRVWLSAAPATDLVMIQRDVAVADDNGIAQTGVLCDPENTDTPGAKYQTDSTYDFGAQPDKLRGTYAFVLLSSGVITVVDIEDFDAPCRKPRQPLDILGCTAAEVTDGDLPHATNESTCNAVTPHTPRLRDFFTWEEQAGAEEPGVQTYPRLTDGTGKSANEQDPARPRMRALVPSQDAPPFDGVHTGLGLTVGNKRLPVSAATGLVDIEGAPNELHDTLLMNFRDPHVHLSQHWEAVFEGQLPGFVGRYGELRIGAAFPTEEGLFEATSRFCDRGVLGYQAVREIVGDDELAATLADRMVIASELPSEVSPHWDNAVCSFQQCNAQFGNPEVPTLGRDLVILEAYQDHLVLADSAVEGIDDELIKCCFPGVISFEVRPAQQWVVIGDSSGYLHRVIEDPATGACRNSCDPRLALNNARVRTVDENTPAEDFVDRAPEYFMNPDPPEDYAKFLMNPMFRFAITRCSPETVCNTSAIIRDSFFQWDTNGGYSPLAIGLSDDLSILPQSMSLNGPAGKLAITDGSLQGLILVDPGTLGETRTYF